MRIFALALLFLGACLIEQPIEEDRDEGPIRNHPPSVLLRSPTSSVLHVQRECRSVPFSLLQLEDFDQGDDLEVRWFVNYDDGNTTPLDTWYIDASEAEGTMRFAGDRGFHLRLDDYLGYSTLVVEAVVSDGFSNQSEHPINRAILRGKGKAVESWTIVISEGSWCNL